MGYHPKIKKIIELNDPFSIAIFDYQRATWAGVISRCGLSWGS
jgi:hypothetical protein